MAKKKDFTEYERNMKDFQKKPLSKDQGELIFPPETNIKESENQDPSVLPATPKLSMRKKAVTVDVDAVSDELLYDFDDFLDWIDSEGNPEKALKKWLEVHKYTATEDEFQYLLKDIKEKMVDIGEASIKRKKKTSSKKLAVGDEFVTPNGTPAKVVDTTPDLVIWVAVDGDDFGSELVEEDLEEGGPPHGRGFGPRKFVDEDIIKEVPLEEGMEFEEI